MEEGSEMFGSPLWMFQRENTNSYVSVKGVMCDTDGQGVCFFGFLFLM